MKYPKTISKGDTIFVSALSNGTTFKHEFLFEKATDFWQSKGFNLRFSPNVKNSSKFVSASAKERAKEFEMAYTDKDINAIIAVAGGEFMMEILPFLNGKTLKKANPKLYVGFSDNTIIEHYLLTHLDTSSLYHYNFNKYGYEKELSVTYGFEAITKQKSSFKSFSKVESQLIKNENGQIIGSVFDKKSNWKVFDKQDNAEFSGRVIGGCIDVLVMYLVAKFDKTKDFIKKYKKDGFIWVLEACDLDAREVKRALWQMKQNHWFEFVKGFVIGRPLCGENVADLSMQEAVLQELEEFNVPIIMDADFGHVMPTIPLYLGSVATFKVKDKKAEVEFKFV